MCLFVVEGMLQIELESYLRHLYPKAKLQNSLGIHQLFQEVKSFLHRLAEEFTFSMQLKVFLSGLPLHHGHYVYVEGKVLKV